MESSFTQSGVPLISWKFSAKHKADKELSPPSQTPRTKLIVKTFTTAGDIITYKYITYECYKSSNYLIKSAPGSRLVSWTLFEAP